MTVSAWGHKVECVSNDVYSRSLNAENLRRLFDRWDEEKLKDTKERLIDDAWEIYLVQLVRDTIFANAGFSLVWIPESFSRVAFETGGCLDYNRFRDFVDFIEGYDYGPIYKCDDDSSELLVWILDEYGKENQKCTS